MSKIAGLVVHFDREYEHEDALDIKRAIEMIRGVVAVHLPATPQQDADLQPGAERPWGILGIRRAR